VGTTEQFLKIISDRARKEISPNIVYRTSMLVTSVIDNSKIKAIIPGDTVEYTLLNKTGEVLSAGNSVVVESNGTNLNNGVVAYKFGNSVVFETIIEKGDDYIKYADGVLQCWGITNQQTTATQISSTGLYYNTTECSATFPVAFISNPVVSLTPNRPDSS